MRKGNVGNEKKVGNIRKRKRKAENEKKGEGNIKERKRKLEEC